MRIFFCQESLDALCELYALLKEEDMLVGIWQKRAKFNETNTALAYEQHGFFEQAQDYYEKVIHIRQRDTDVSLCESTSVRTSHK